MRRLREIVGAGVAMMTVVKADGYGHGMVRGRPAPPGRPGADWLGVATLDEALALRAAGDTGRVLCWLAVPGEEYADAIAADIDVTAYSRAELDEIVATGRRARVQLKVDTGLARGGAARADWQDLFAHAAELEQAGRLDITGIWTHLAASDEPDHPANDAQETAFREAVELAESLGVATRAQAPRQLGCRGAPALGPFRPRAVRHRDVRPRPGPRVTPPTSGSIPAMTVRASLAMSKPVAGR